MCEISDHSCYLFPTSKNYEDFDNTDCKYHDKNFSEDIISNDIKDCLSTATHKNINEKETY